MNIVQIGTNKAHDYLSDIVHSYQQNSIHHLILVEPFAYHNLSIQNCYSRFRDNLCIENIIITPNTNHDKQEQIWYHDLDSQHSNAYELASLNPKHAHNIRNNYQLNDMKNLWLDCYTINELFDKYNLIDIHTLAIDTEGFDDQIIYSINFDKYKITTILYEHLHINKEQLREFLKNKGYVIETEIPQDPYTDQATQR